MIIESGVIILIGFLLIVIKLPRRMLLRMLGWPLTVDITGATVAYVLHWGTFSGVMAAAVAGLMISACTSIGRWAVGYIDKDGYHKGALMNWEAYA